MSDSVTTQIWEALNLVGEPVWCVQPETYELIFGNDTFFAHAPQAKPGTDIRAQLASDPNLFVSAAERAREVGCSMCPVQFPAMAGKGVFDTTIRHSEAREGAEAALICKGSFRPTGYDGRPYVNGNYTFLENIKDVFFILDHDARFLYYNKAFRRFILERKLDVTEKTIWEVFPDIRGLKFEEAYERTLREQTSLEFEEYLPSSRRWLSVLTYPAPQYLYVFVHDITLRKELDQSLVESEHMFHTMSDNSPMLIWTLNEKLAPTFFNKTFLEFLGPGYSSLQQHGWLPLVHEDDQETASQSWQSGLYQRTLITLECRLRRQDGAYRWIRINALPQFEFNGTFAGYLVNGTDFTDLKFYSEILEERNKQLERALNESRRLSGILNKTTNILVLTDVEGKITWVNDAFTRYKEYTLAEVIGKKPGPLVYGPETSLETIEILREGIRKKEITRVEILNYSKYGNKMWLDVRIEPIFRNGMPEGYMAIEMDITKRKKDELALKEKNEKIKEFSFITSHELRHEFAKVMLLLNMAKSQENTVEDYKTLFNHLDDPINKINHIISRINANLYLGEAQKSMEEKMNEMEEIREICLVDDDELTNLIHKQIIKIIMPHTPIRTYDNVDEALTYFNVQPGSNRLVFLDLVFLNGKSGWEFLDEYSKMDDFAPVIILSSSIDNEDLNKSKNYKCVLEYFVKPLTAETLHKYIRKGQYPASQS